MLTTEQILNELADRGVKSADIARVLKIDPSGVARLKHGSRRLLLDEAIKLMEAFRLERPLSQVSLLPTESARLIVRYVAEELKARVSEEQIREIAEDVRAFAEFVNEPKAPRSVEAAEAFFDAMRIRRRPGG
jgi:transcriptional regulator with XRE-family HTH domain